MPNSSTKPTASSSGAATPATCSPLDPFAGVGSTGVAAVLAGRRAILVELDPDRRYLPTAIARLRHAEHLADRAAEA